VEVSVRLPGQKAGKHILARTVIGFGIKKNQAAAL
jgi:hypothetical protein